MKNILITLVLVLCVGSVWAGECQYIGQLECSGLAGLHGYKFCECANGICQGMPLELEWSQFISCGDNQVCNSDHDDNLRKVCINNPQGAGGNPPLGSADCDELHVGSYTCSKKLSLKGFKVCECRANRVGEFDCSWGQFIPCDRGDACDGTADTFENACVRPQGLHPSLAGGTSNIYKPIMHGNGSGAGRRARPAAAQPVPTNILPIIMDYVLSDDAVE